MEDGSLKKFVYYGSRSITGIGLFWNRVSYESRSLNEVGSIRKWVFYGRRSITEIGFLWKQVQYGSGPLMKEGLLWK